MTGFFQQIVDWQRVSGRHGLPWQGTHDPYRIWLSEIMLQQTQVSTVLNYYGRFLQRFPDVQTLAAAPLDEVLAHWSGLGYYSRARHLHRCAMEVVAHWNGRFPPSAATLQQLPGIGRSTAAAIAAFSLGERVSILDGNVQRVLTRWLGDAADLAQAAHVKALWQKADALIPADATHADMVAYTQGLMDMGATVCKRTRPACTACPVQSGCVAAQQAHPSQFPVKTRRLKRQTEAWWLRVLRRVDDGAYWMQPRSHEGIWPGLYAFPVVASADEAAAPPNESPAGAEPVWHPPLRHALTHKELVLHLVEWPVLAVPDGLPGLWVAGPHDQAVGMPAPLRAWLVARSAPPTPLAQQPLWR